MGEGYGEKSITVLVASKGELKLADSKIKKILVSFLVSLLLKKYYNIF